MSHVQGATCSVCRKLMAVSSAGDYKAAPHNANGQPCAGAGKVVRLLSAGLLGGPGWIRNGKAEKR